MQQKVIVNAQQLTLIARTLLTLREVADEMDVTVATVKRWEQGEVAQIRFVEYFEGLAHVCALKFDRVGLPRVAEAFIRDFPAARVSEIVVARRPVKKKPRDIQHRRA